MEFRINAGAYEFSGIKTSTVFSSPVYTSDTEVISILIMNQDQNLKKSEAIPVWAYLKMKNRDE